MSLWHNSRRAWTEIVWRPKSITHCLATKHFTVWTPSLVLFDLVWSRLVVFVEFEGHQIFDQKHKTFLLFSCLSGDVLLVWSAAYQTCLKQACIRTTLFGGLYQLFHLCLIKHVLIVWPLTSTSACLVTKQCVMVFSRQAFLVFPGPYSKDECIDYEIFPLLCVKHIKGT